MPYATLPEHAPVVITSLAKFYSCKKQYRLKLATTHLVVAANWLRSNGCRFNTYTDYNTRMTTITFTTLPNDVRDALVRKFGCEHF